MNLARKIEHANRIPYMWHECAITEDDATRARRTVCAITGEAGRAREILMMLDLLPKATVAKVWTRAQVIPCSPMPSRSEIDEMHEWMLANGYLREVRSA